MFIMLPSPKEGGGDEPNSSTIVAPYYKYRMYKKDHFDITNRKIFEGGVVDFCFIVEGPVILV